jgi:hypothetical protein
LRHNILADNFVYTISRHNQGKKGKSFYMRSQSLSLYALPISLWSLYTICMMVKDKRMFILYAIIYVINLCLHFISRFGRFYEDFPFHSLSLSLSLSLSPLSLSLSFSLSLCLSLSLISPSLSYISLPLYISPSTFLSLSLLLSLFSLSFYLAYLMDVFVLVKL